MLDSFSENNNKKLRRFIKIAHKNFHRPEERASCISLKVHMEDFTRKTGLRNKHKNKINIEIEKT